MSKQWRIYCLDPQDIGWKYVWSDTPITECPNDNTHSVNNQSVSEISEEIATLRYTFMPEEYSVIKLKKNIFMRILTFPYTKNLGFIKRLGIILGESDNVKTFTIQLLDPGDKKVLTEKQFEPKLNSVMKLKVDNNPKEESVLEVYIKLDTEKGSSAKFYINHFILYADSNTV